MSLRFASTITGTPAARVRSQTRASASRPAGPKRSKYAICGLTAATESSAASSSAPAKLSIPSGVSGRPAAWSEPLAGSMPRQSGDRWSISSRTRSANGTPPRLSGLQRPEVPHEHLVRPDRASHRGGRVEQDVVRVEAHARVEAAARQRHRLLEDRLHEGELADVRVEVGVGA